MSDHLSSEHLCQNLERLLQRLRREPSEILDESSPVHRTNLVQDDESRLALMKTGVMLINTARGGIIDTQALLDGLKSGKVGYAGLDVYEEEANFFYKDLSDSHITDDILARLTTFTNVMVTGHQGSLTDVAQSQMAETTLENIREFELGKRGSELTNAVTARAG